ncbi:hypothetical protein Curi_c17040 [Gottschalkia acidurici 9a]|uniref:Uncharacterized protein n=1 Tax=Gottschalkia acidurici (strain ATCC 7906 / DSM 604 / BCRC 14475 / CIP 104303 / KCTC 5404 / NCIMB 10678 / 9a) TaxID=1128398 RepID=K0B222_GOTA9|nr:hypothetical protein [Gottschalkia acidurici]AFS78711.1 hypothetical protein Curi_c17040 [Gottschalkia acidurici 9a]
MIFFELQIFLITMFLVCIIGYVLVVIKEKINLMDNTIIIDKKSVTQDCIDEAEIKIFMLGGQEIRSGDEVKITLPGNEMIEGIVIGAKIKQNELMLVTHRDEVKKFKVDKIKRVKIISKYGRFFKAF